MNIMSMNNGTGKVLPQIKEQTTVDLPFQDQNSGPCSSATIRCLPTTSFQLAFGTATPPERY